MTASLLTNNSLVTNMEHQNRMPHTADQGCLLCMIYCFMSAFSNLHEPSLPKP